MYAKNDFSTVFVYVKSNAERCQAEIKKFAPAFRDLKWAPKKLKMG